MNAISTSIRTLNSLTRYAYAQDDAAAFLASNGEIRGAFFEQALREQRSLHPVGDDDFAFAVIANSGPK
jgi:uncharacterized protein (TIGR02448 family)